MHKGPVNDDVMTTRQAGEVLGVAVRTVQLWVEAGVLPAWRTAGGHRRIARAAVEKLLGERKRGLMPDLPEDPPAEAVAAKSSGLRALRMVLVEDDVNLSNLFANMVREWGLPIELTTAVNGFDGLLRMGEINPDVVITDLLMPGMDGFEMLRNLKSTGGRFKDLKILVVSALTAAEVEARGGLPEGVMFFQKPLRYSKLEAVVRKHYADHIVPGGPKATA